MPRVPALIHIIHIALFVRTNGKSLKSFVINQFSFRLRGV